MKHVKGDRLGRSGQNMAETILLLPLYLLFVFGLLQIGQLGTAVLVANYGAATIARQLVKDGMAGSGWIPLSDPYSAKFTKLMVAGMQYDEARYGLKAKRELDSTTGGSSLLSNITVHACAKVSAFPFVGLLMAKPLGNQYAGSLGCQDGQPSLGPIFFTGTAPYYFVVHGQATARMNYQP